MGQDKIENDLYEVVVVPQDPSLRETLSIRMHTFANQPTEALQKVQRHIAELQPNFLSLVGNIDFVIQRLSFLK